MRTVARSLPTLALLAFALMLVLGLAACLPAGTRGTGGPGSAASGSATTLATATPRPVPPGPSPTPSFLAPTPTPAPTFFVYTVVRGDSLNTIAHKFATTGRSIAYWNRTTYPSLDPESESYKPGYIKIGWTLYLVPNLIVDEETGEPVYPSGAVPAP